MPTEKFAGIFTATGGKSGKINMANISSSTKIVETGYELEIKIPWQELGGYVPKSGNVIGFDIGIDDSDKEERKYQLYWQGKEDNYKNRFNFGRMILK
jgi:hypothetical protein